MARDDHDPFEYDVALSFAGEDWAVAEKFAGLLVAKNLSVFHDEYPNVAPAEGDLIIHTAELYRRRARYCVMLISQHYPLEKWTEVERTSAREHSLRDAEEYIIPIMLDDADVPGLTGSTGSMDLRQRSMESIADFLKQRFDEPTGRSSGPPPGLTTFDRVTSHRNNKIHERRTRLRLGILNRRISELDHKDFGYCSLILVNCLNAPTHGFPSL